MATLIQEPQIVQAFLADTCVGEAVLEGNTWVCSFNQKGDTPVSFMDGFLAKRYLAAFPNHEATFRTDEAVFYEEKYLRRFWK